MYKYRDYVIITRSAPDFSSFEARVCDPNKEISERVVHVASSMEAACKWIDAQTPDNSRPHKLREVRSADDP